MKVLLLAAGFGTRLQPLTDSIPKCLVPIKGVPLLKIWLDKLIKLGFTDIFLNTHYLSEKVEDFLNENNYGSINIISEEILLGTAGTLINNINSFLDDDLMLIHADNYCLDDLNSFLNAHRNRPSSCLMTMLTFRTTTPRTCGIVEIDENNIIINYHEKSELDFGNLANGAVYILSKECLLNIYSNFKHSIDFSNDILPNLISKIYTYETGKMYLDIGTPESYKFANEF